MKVSELEKKLAEYRDLEQRIQFLQDEIGKWSVAESDQTVDSGWRIVVNSGFAHHASPCRLFCFPKQNRDDVIVALKAHVEVLTAKRDALEIETCSSKAQSEAEQG